VTDDEQQIDVADPTTAPFWDACREHRLMVQKCSDCSAHQFYPRPFCLACEGESLDWVEVSGSGTIYSKTVVRIPVTPDLEPPYALAIVELDEGPRLLSNIDDLDAEIGDRVTLDWRSRDPLPPVPVFKRGGPNRS